MLTPRDNEWLILFVEQPEPQARALGQVLAPVLESVPVPALTLVQAQAEALASALAQAQALAPVPVQAVALVSVLTPAQALAPECKGEFPFKDHRSKTAGKLPVDLSRHRSTKCLVLITVLTPYR